VATSGVTRARSPPTASRRPATSVQTCSAAETTSVTVLNAPRIRATAVAMVDHGRVGLEDLPQDAQRGGGGVPAALGATGEFGPGEQLPAEARVEFEQ